MRYVRKLPSIDYNNGDLHARGPGGELVRGEFYAGLGT